MIYQPLSYLIGMEGRALLRAWAGDYDYDQRFVEARIAEVRRLLADEMLTSSPGVLVERGATYATYRQWSASYDEPGNGLFDIDEPIIDEILDTLPVGSAVDAACGTGRVAARLVQRGHHVIGVDSSPEMLHRARRRLPDSEFMEDPPRLGGENDRPVRGGPDGFHSPSFRRRLFAGRPREGPSGTPVRGGTRPGPPGPAPEPAHEMGTWPDWPWTLLGLVPEATQAAWNDPAIVVWHLQLG